MGDMSYAEAAELLGYLGDGENNLNFYHMAAVEVAIKRLNEPQIINNLAVCGCGWQAEYLDDVPFMWRVACRGCGVGTKPCNDRYKCREQWNESMGVKG